MQIDKEKFVELLIGKSGLDEGQVREQLDELLNNIQQATEEGQSFEIEDFGTFKMEDDRLQFEPAPNLETEINHKYAGMQPIELMGAFKDIPDVAVEDEQATADIVEAEDESEEGSPAPEASETEVTEEKKRSSFQFDEDASEIDSPEPETQGDVYKETQGRQAVPEESKPEPVLAKEEKEDSPKGSQTSKKVDKEESDPIGKFLVAAVIVIALGVSGWFAYDFGLLDSVLGNNTNTPRQTVQNTGGSVPANQNKESAKANLDNSKSDSEQNKENDVPKSASIAEQSKGSIYGLRGGAVPKVESGYTIVVHSLRSKFKAEDVEQDLKSEGYLTILRSAVVRGTTYWRVGLGQFKNVDDAKQAINDLPAPYKQDNFIRKF